MLPKPRVFLTTGCLACLVAITAHATADGPEHYRVTGVAAEDVLNMRAAPDASGALVGTIPHGGDGLLAFDCVGGLGLVEWENASEDEREAARKTRWCLVGYDRVIGWAAAWHLAEGNGPDNFRGGSWLTSLAGSEWVLRDIAGTPVGVEAWVGFKSNGTFLGNSACNRFNGSYTEDRGALTLGPVAMTRRACAGADGETESGFMQALSRVKRIAATHLLLALLDDEGTVLATLIRRDAD
jgi:heat shock protein HslJ